MAAALVAFCLVTLGPERGDPRPGRERPRVVQHSAGYWRWLARARARKLEAVRAETRRVVRAKLRLQRRLRGGLAAARPDVLHAIALASVTYGVPMSEMVAVAECESGLDPGLAPNSASATGLFQFLYPSTWSRTPYAAFSVYDATANALAAAWLVRQDGGWSEWTCRP